MRFMIFNSCPNNYTVFGTTVIRCLKTSNIGKAINGFRNLNTNGNIIHQQIMRCETNQFDSLWKHIQENGKESFKLTFAEIEQIAGLPIDHSFLNYKKELLEYGYKVVKISMKEQSVSFQMIGE